MTFLDYKLHVATTKQPTNQKVRIIDNQMII